MVRSLRTFPLLDGYRGARPVDVRAGETFLGGELAQDGPIELSIHVRGYRDLARIEVVRNGELAHVIRPDLDLPAGWIEVPVRVEWGRAGRPRRWDGRLTVHGGEVLPTPYYGPEVREVSTSSVRWEAATTSFGGGGLYGPTRGGVDVTLVGPPQASVAVDAASGSLTARLGDLQDAPVDAIGANAPDEVLDFIRLVMDNYELIAATPGTIPVVEGGEEMLENPAMLPIVEQLAQGTGFQLYLDQDFPEAVGSQVNESVGALIAGQSSPDDVVNQINEVWEREG
jgi:hypothetical protein